MTLADNITLLAQRIATEFNNLRSDITSQMTGKVSTSDSRLTDARTPLAHTHVSVDVTDATSSNTANKLVKRDGGGGADFVWLSGGDISAWNAPSTAANVTRKDYVDTQVATRAPTSHTHTTTQISDSTVVGRTVLTSPDAASARTAIGAGTSSLAIGTTSTTAAAGNDSRLSDARTPLAHTHPVTDLTATGTRDSTTFLRGDNTWAVPAGGAGTTSMTKAQRLALSTASLAANYTVYETDTDMIWAWTGSKWRYRGGGATPFIHVRRANTNALALTTNAWTGLPFDTVIESNDSTLWASANPSRLTVPFDGLYFASGSIGFYNAGAVQARYLGIRKSGSTIHRITATNSNPAEQSAETVLKLTSTDYVELVYFVSATDTATAYTELQNQLQLTWVGNI